MKILEFLQYALPFIGVGIGAAVFFANQKLAKFRALGLALYILALSLFLSSLCAHFVSPNHFSVLICTGVVIMCIGLFVRRKK